MSAADLLDDAFPHGTVQGFDRGCRTNHCPAAEEGLSCNAVRTRYMSDWGFRRGIDAGRTVAELLEVERAGAAEEVERERAAIRAEREAERAARATRPRLTDEEKAARAAAKEEAAAERRAAREAARERARAGNAEEARLARESRSAERAAAAALDRADRNAARAKTREERDRERAALGLGRTNAAPLERVAELHAQGLLDGEIGAELGLSESRASQIRRELGLPGQPRSLKRATRTRKTADQLVHGTTGGYGRGCHAHEDCPNVAAGGISCHEASRKYHNEYMAKRRAAGVPAEQHGTAYGYQLGCRTRENCPAEVSCVDAMNQSDTARRRRAGIGEPKRAEHGTRGGYRSLGCRVTSQCPSKLAGGKSCSEANREHQQAQVERRRKRDGWKPSSRRLSAEQIEAIRSRSLANITDTQIASELGMHQATVSKVRRRLELPAVAGSYGKKLTA